MKTLNQKKMEEQILKMMLVLEMKLQSEKITEIFVNNETK